MKRTECSCKWWDIILSLYLVLYSILISVRTWPEGTEVLENSVEKKELVRLKRSRQTKAHRNGSI